MEIALFLVLAFISVVYFSAGKRNTKLHRDFSMLLIIAQVHLIFDGITVYTVNRLETVPILLNDILHRVFIMTLLATVYMFYRYISHLIEEDAGKSKLLDTLSVIFLAVSEVSAAVLPVHYAVTPKGNYSDGVMLTVCYAAVAFYLVMCAVLILIGGRHLDGKKRFAVGVALAVEFCVSALQAINPHWLISGMGITLMTLSFYLTLENPDILRAELTEQKMSMLYLKSQVNPHFLYNTLDTIRIQAQLNGDQKVASLLMRLVDFFRISVKVNRPTVPLDDELEMIEAYLELMCYRYPELSCSYDIDPELLGAKVPNFILQPVVENSLLHGLKNKGYRGSVTVSAQKADADGCMVLSVTDTGSGFAPGVKEMVDKMLENYRNRPAKLEGNSIGLLNVQKRIKLLCGKDCGLSFTENPDGGVCARMVLRYDTDTAIVQ